ncbi:MAG: SCP2 sterol-binding domain-containing protein [bacterium]|nr:SCP2 sterol-binding domain-containing protein [bacterium]MCP5070249.1 SCP2 sterol-binding domain-containing protein [bacterium]
MEPFFVHVGSFVAVIVYFVVLGRAADPETGVAVALPTALAVMTGYMLWARHVRLLKQFDFGLWTMFAVGTAAVHGGSEGARSLFASYSPAILFFTLATVALLPLLLGRETFTVFFARRGTPAWQQKTRDFVVINRIIAGWFGALFLTAAALVTWAPHDFRFSIVYPNLLIFVIGMPTQLWFPPLYLRIFGPHPPESVETAILGMPLTFDAKAAGEARATIQFRVTGEEGGDYWMRVGDGACESSEGEASAADLVIHTPDAVWLGIARGEIDPAQALLDQQYSIEGDSAILLSFGEWFPSRS